MNYFRFALMGSTLTIIIILLISYKGEFQFDKQFMYSQKSDNYLGTSDTLITNKVHDFLSWYQYNFKSLEEWQFIDFGNDSIPYSLNLTKTDAYIEYLNNSQYFTTHFIDSISNYFNSISDLLIDFPQYDGQVAGLDADILLRIQEIDETILLISDAKIELLESSESEATVYAQLIYPRTFKLTNLNGFWKIDAISIAD